MIILSCNSHLCITLFAFSYTPWQPSMEEDYFLAEWSSGWCRGLVIRLDGRVLALSRARQLTRSAPAVHIVAGALSIMDNGTGRETRDGKHCCEQAKCF